MMSTFKDISILIALTLVVLVQVSCGFTNLRKFGSESIISPMWLGVARIHGDGSAIVETGAPPSTGAGPSGTGTTTSSSIVTIGSGSAVTGTAVECILKPDPTGQSVLVDPRKDHSPFFELLLPLELADQLSDSDFTLSGFWRGDAGNALPRIFNFGVITRQDHGRHGTVFRLYPESTLKAGGVYNIKVNGTLAELIGSMTFISFPGEFSSGTAPYYFTETFLYEEEFTRNQFDIVPFTEMIYQDLHAFPLKFINFDPSSGSACASDINTDAVLDDLDLDSMTQILSKGSVDATDVFEHYLNWFSPQKNIP